MVALVAQWFAGAARPHWWSGARQPALLGLLRQLPRRARLLADRGYDADWIRAFVTERGAWANIPPKRNRKDPICFSPYLYRDRNLVERFFELKAEYETL